MTLREYEAVKLSMPNLTEVLLCARSYFGAFVARESWIRRLTHTFDLVSTRSTCEKLYYEIDFSALSAFFIEGKTFFEENCWLPLAVIKRKSLTSMAITSASGCKPALATREENTKVLLFIILGWVSHQGYRLSSLSNDALVDLYLYLLDPDAYPLKCLSVDEEEGQSGADFIVEVRDLFKIPRFKKLLSYFKDHYLLVSIVSREPDSVIAEFEISVEYGVSPEASNRSVLKKIAPVPMEWDVLVSAPIESLGEHVRIIPPSAARIVSCGVLGRWNEESEKSDGYKVGEESLPALMKASPDSGIGKKRGAVGAPISKIDAGRIAKFDGKSEREYRGAAVDVFFRRLPFAEDEESGPEVIVTDSIVVLVRPHCTSPFAPLQAYRIVLELSTKRRLFLTPAFFASLFSLIMTVIVVIWPGYPSSFVDQNVGENKIAFVAAIVPPMVASLVHFKLEDDLMTINLAFSRMVFTISSFLLLFYVSIASQIEYSPFLGPLVFLLQLLVFLHFSAQLFFIWLYSNSVDFGVRRAGHINASFVAIGALLVSWGILI